MGRNKILYGRLRDICLDKFPQLMDMGRENFKELNAAFMAYTDNWNSDEAHIQYEDERARAFFAREDLQRALMNRLYVEANVLKLWTSYHRSPGFLRGLKSFYLTHPTAPAAAEILERIDKAVEIQRLLKQNTEDTQALASYDLISVNYRPFLRYWLNTAFLGLNEFKRYLSEQLPASPDWTDRLFGAENGEEIMPLSLSVSAGGIKFEVLLHRFYVQYRRDGRELFGVFLPYEKLLPCDNETFFLLLPAADMTGIDSGELTEELKRRLEDTALPKENVDDTAHILGRGLGTPCFTVYQETPYSLYGAEWSADDGRIYIFESSDGIKQYSSEEYGSAFSEEEAVVLGKRFLSDIISPAAIDFSYLISMPETVYVSGAASRSKEEKYCGDELTVEKLNTLMESFAAGETERLELAFALSSWELKRQEPEAYERKRSLVFLWKNRYFECLCFDDSEEFFYALGRRNVSIGAEGERFVSLSHRETPEVCRFASFLSIQNSLPQILSLISASGAKINMADDMGVCYWMKAWSGVHVADRRIMYNLAKQEIGGFPLERAYNPVELPVALGDFMEQGSGAGRRPAAELEQWSAAGEHKTAEIDNNSRLLLKQAVSSFFSGELTQLRISWDIRPESYRPFFADSYYTDYLAKCGDEPVQTHIVLRRDGDRYMLLCMQDFCRAAEYYVGDISTYLDVEGKKYPKDTFQGKTVPAYLLHKNLLRLRNRLDLLLDYKECIYPITGRFAEFAKESPVKPREYELIRAEFVTDKGAG